MRDRFPTNIHPLAFFDYDEEKIKTELEGIGGRRLQTQIQTRPLSACSMLMQTRFIWIASDSILMAR